VDHSYSSTLSLTSALDVVQWLTSRPGRFTSSKDIRYPLYRRLGGPQGRCGRVRKFSHSTACEPRTAQPVDSRYIDWAILTHEGRTYRTLFIGCALYVNPPPPRWVPWYSCTRASSGCGGDDSMQVQRVTVNVACTSGALLRFLESGVAQFAYLSPGKHRNTACSHSVATPFNSLEFQQPLKLEHEKTRLKQDLSFAMW
jgi:hypothetical protein